MEIDSDQDIVYELDEETGFLMDENGKYLLDDMGLPIKLNNEHILYLKSNDMILESWLYFNVIYNSSISFNSLQF